MCRLSWNALKSAALFLSGNRTTLLYNKLNNTWMLRNMKLFLLLNLVNTRNKFHISAHPYIMLYIMSSMMSKTFLVRYLMLTWELNIFEHAWVICISEFYYASRLTQYDRIHRFTTAWDFCSAWSIFTER